MVSHTGQQTHHSHRSSTGACLTWYSMGSRSRLLELATRRRKAAKQWFTKGGLVAYPAVHKHALNGIHDVPNYSACQAMNGTRHVGKQWFSKGGLSPYPAVHKQALSGIHHVSSYSACQALNGTRHVGKQDC